MIDFLESLPLAVLASLVAAGVATLGLVIVSINDAWAMRNRVHFAAFASGILVTTALLLLPSAFKAHPNAPFVALAGYLLLFGVNALFRQGKGLMVIAPLFAIGIHSFLDGFEYGILFDHDPFVGWVASIGLITHEFAEAVILYAVLRTGGANALVSWLGGFIGAAITTPLGAVVSLEVLDGMSQPDFGLFLAAAAGALLYVGATHLPTHVIDGIRARVLIAYLLGVLLAFGLSFGHDHIEEPHDASMGHEQDPHDH
ncbi:ZIP family metal transporter [Parvularcula marina]|uniref:ZIP family metal transporter n=1 Tax=Parvularcula marina TaxID=2292771 RepID=UPI003511009B